MPGLRMAMSATWDILSGKASCNGYTDATRMGNLVRIRSNKFALGASEYPPLAGRNPAYGVGEASMGIPTRIRTATGLLSRSAGLNFQRLSASLAASSISG